MSVHRAPVTTAVAALLSIALGDRASADLITHAIVSYGDATLITVEEFGTTHAAATNSYTSPGLFIGTAEAWAGYGLVRGRAAAQAQNTTYQTQVAQAEAVFTDLFTIGGATGQGFVVYEYTVTGSTIGSEHDAHAHLFVRHQGEPDEELGHLTSSAVLSSMPHAFTFGTPFSAGALLSAEIHLHDGHTGAVLADFSPGAMLTRLSIFDAQMTPVAQFTISSGSGTQYPLPTPGAAGVLVLAAALSGRVRRSPAGA